MRRFVFPTNDVVLYATVSSTGNSSEYTDTWAALRALYNTTLVRQPRYQLLVEVLDFSMSETTWGQGYWDEK